MCGFAPEMLKAGKVVVHRQAEIFNTVWRVGSALGDWKNAVIVPIHKKSSRMECTNYRGISMMSIVGKVFVRVLNDRVEVWIVDKVMKETSGLEDDVFIRSML